MVTEDLVPKFTDEQNFWFEFGQTGGYLRYYSRSLEEDQKDFQNTLAKTEDLPDKRTHEYGSYIIEAMETNVPISIHGNVRNWA